MSISVVTFANLGRKQNLKTPDIIPLLEKLQKEGVLGQVIFQLGTDVPYTNAVSAVPKLIRYIFGALRRIRVYPPRHLEETVFDFFACRKLAPASVVFFHGGYFLPRTVRRARAQGAIVIDLAVSAHPKTNASLEREELAYLGLKGFEASYMRVEKESRHVNAFDYVIGMSPFVKQTYVDAGFSEDRVFVASPDIDLKRFTPGHTSPKEFEILYMAHTQPLKGLHYLLDAWEIIKLLCRARLGSGMSRECTLLQFRMFQGLIRRRIISAPLRSSCFLR
jgi:glycosyltransferase involved in cell wall biosynthesis